MNEVLRRKRRRLPRKGFLKHAVWSAANSLALGGLCPWMEPEWLHVERREMPLRGLGRPWAGATVAHISDLHCSPIVRRRYLAHCIEAVNALGVDFVAITGDFVTGPKQYARVVAGLLGRLRPGVATIACLGNHDYGIFHPRGVGRTRGLAECLAWELTRAGVYLLLGEAAVFHRDGAKIQFVGLEDYWTSGFDPVGTFAAADPDAPTIVLCHNPDAAPELAACGAQWILAGHTHGRTSSPNPLGRLMTPARLKHLVSGHYRLGDETSLYINRGLSYGRRKRYHQRPEITVFTLRQQA